MKFKTDEEFQAWLSEMQELLKKGNNIEPPKIVVAHLDEGDLIVIPKYYTEKFSEAIAKFLLFQENIGEHKVVYKGVDTIPNNGE